MTNTLDNLQRIEYRAVLIDGHSKRVLAIATAAGPLLPRVSIPPYTRVAESLTEAIDLRYNLRTIQLCSLPDREQYNCCAVLEIVGMQQAMRGPLSFVELDEIASNELTSEERATIQKIMKGVADELGHFGQSGWIEKLLIRLGSYQDRGTRPLIRQLNQGTNFCLLSVTKATGDRVWFKAVGEPNACEYALTIELARRFPGCMPKILATIPEWNGWITQDAGGVPLNESASIDQCERALSALAVMQKGMINDVSSLSALGAKNWTYARISMLARPFFQEALCAMQAQTSVKSKPLSDAELFQLQSATESALDEFMNTGIPETLLHGDIGHGNVIATCGGPVFLDWAETCIGHPFLCAEHLLADLARSNPMFNAIQPALRSHYAAHWREFVRPEELKKVTALAPAIGAFAYALIAWDANHNRPDPSQAWPLIRSMLRRTKRELKQATEVSA
jgi:hypothetical protein